MDSHEPVLAAEVAGVLVPVLAGGGVLLDATVGLGGHAHRLLLGAPRATLIGIDRDPYALAQARARLAGLGQRVELVRGEFAQLAAVLERLGSAPLRGVLFDLGVSSPQLDRPERGFSFRHDGPLDMRMDPSRQLTAEHVVNHYEEAELARVIARYGEERYARRIARAIVRNRPILSTGRLAEVVAEVIPQPSRRGARIHPARRTFQALRIEVNDELGQLEQALPAALERLEPGGRICVISYHSLEDRIVKRTFARAARGCICPPDLPMCSCGARATLRLLTRRAVRPSEAEVAANPRASAARLRSAEKLDEGAA
jgi:16S rRNA (cytosine1402-N4)-methyltransferase